MAQSHPIAATIFVGVVLGTVAYGTQSALVHQRAEAERQVAERAAKRKLNIETAVIQGQAGDYEGASLLLQSVLREYPGDLDASYNLGIALSAMTRYDEAEKVFSAILKASPDDFDAMAELAAVYDGKGDAERAMQLLDKIPAGKAELAARLGDESRWTAIRAHARFRELALKVGLTQTSTPAAQ